MNGRASLPVCPPPPHCPPPVAAGSPDAALARPRALRGPLGPSPPTWHLRPPGASYVGLSGLWRGTSGAPAAAPASWTRTASGSSRTSRRQAI